MTRALVLLAIATTSLTFACSTELGDDFVEDSPESLTKREGTYIGEYQTNDTTVEVQNLFLQKDNVFSAGFSEALTGKKIKCAAAPCVLPVSGEWHVTKRNAKLKLTLEWALPKGVENGGSLVKTSYELAMPEVESKIDSLELKRDGKPAFTLKRAVVCPAIEPRPPVAKCNGKWEPVYNPDGCFLGTKCTPLQPPVACPKFEPSPIAMKCLGKLENVYDENKCLIGIKCVSAI